MSKELKELYAHLPHVKSVWIKGDHAYLVKVHGAKKIFLDDVQVQEEKQAKQKPSKIKKEE